MLDVPPYTYWSNADATYPVFEPIEGSRVVTVAFDELPQSAAKRKSHLADNGILLPIHYSLQMHFSSPSWPPSPIHSTTHLSTPPPLPHTSNLTDAQQLSLLRTMPRTQPEQTLEVYFSTINSLHRPYIWGIYFQVRGLMAV